MCFGELSRKLRFFKTARHKGGVLRKAAPSVFRVVGGSSHWSATAFPSNRTYDILSNLPHEAVHGPASEFSSTL